MEPGFVACRVADRRMPRQCERECPKETPGSARSVPGDVLACWGCGADALPRHVAVTSVPGRAVVPCGEAAWATPETPAAARIRET